MSIKYNGGYIPAVGADGTTLVANSASATGVAWAGPSVAAGKNFLINGGFDIWQRGTSSSTTGVYLADRWVCASGGSTTSTQSQETSVIQNGSTYAIKTLTNTASSFMQLYQPLESFTVNMIAGQTVTASAYVRALASFSGTANIVIDTNTTANVAFGGTWTNLVTTSITPSTSGYTRITATATIPAGTAGVRIGLLYNSPQASGTGLYWSQAQLELGSVATAFSRAGGTLQGELAACQRYYQKTYPQGTAVPTNATTAGILSIGSAAVATNTNYGYAAFKTTMRAAPTMTIYSYTSSTVGVVSNSAGSDLAASSGNTNYIGDSGFTLLNSSGGSLTPANGGFICHYVASAEL